jgi:hypothetical protein
MPKGSAMCGYGVFGNHLSREDPKIEWDMNVDEIVNGAERVAAVSAEVGSSLPLFANRACSGPCNSASCR